jgi:hypothetical protein
MIIGGAVAHCKRLRDRLQFSIWPKQEVAGKRVLRKSGVGCGERILGGRTSLSDVYNPRLSPLAGIVMEAERINAVANHIVDLKSREVELRRYL